MQRTLDSYEFFRKKTSDDTLGALLTIAHGMLRGDPPHEQEMLLTVTEVAQLLQISQDTVYNLIHTGELPHCRFGNAIRIPRQALEQYLRTLYTTPQEPTTLRLAS